MVVLDLRKATAFTDYFVLASGANQKQIVAIADAVQETLRGAGPAARRTSRATRARSGSCSTTATFVVHVFTPRMRAFYDLERLWGGATRHGGRADERGRGRDAWPAWWRCRRPCASCCEVAAAPGRGARARCWWRARAAPARTCSRTGSTTSGPRRDGPFIKIHCPSIPEDLLESELFGHEKGAFTDARQAKAGKIELAAGGTLYFDQVQDLSLPLQAKLLRVVEERRFERLGGTRTLEVDVRFVSVVQRRPAPGGGTRARSARTSTTA